MMSAKTAEHSSMRYRATLLIPSFILKDAGGPITGQTVEERRALMARWGGARHRPLKPLRLARKTCKSRTLLPGRRLEAHS
jgi:hypothetical protein